MNPGDILVYQGTVRVEFVRQVGEQAIVKIGADTQLVSITALSKDKLN